MLKIIRKLKIRKISIEIKQMLAISRSLSEEAQSYRMMARDYEFWGDNEEARKARCEAIKREKEYNYYCDEVERLIDEKFELAN